MDAKASKCYGALAERKQIARRAVEQIAHERDHLDADGFRYTIDNAGQLRVRDIAAPGKQQSMELCDSADTCFCHKRLDVESIGGRNGWLHRDIC